MYEPFSDHAFFSAFVFYCFTVKMPKAFKEFLCQVEPLYFSDEKSTTAEKLQIYNDAIHQLDKLNSFPAIAFELVK